MKENFDQALAWIQADEGGGAIRADEPGGGVFHGITLEAYDWYCIRHGRPKPSMDDLMHMSMDDEKAIYREDYADKIGFDSLPWPLDYVMFNCAVMSGTTMAKALWLKARTDDPVKTALSIMLLQMGNMMQRNTVVKYGTGWANRMGRVWNRIIHDQMA